MAARAGTLKYAELPHQFLPFSLTFQPYHPPQQTHPFPKWLPLLRPPSVTILGQSIYHFNSTLEASSDLHNSARCLLDTSSVNTYPKPTTASQQQTWPPTPLSARQTPPTPQFSQDFQLFDHPIPAPSRRAPSRGPTQLPSFNNALPGGLQPNGNYLIAQRDTRTTRPPVPLFHANSTGHLGNQSNIQDIQQQQPQTDITSFMMGGGGNSAQLDLSTESDLIMDSEINVAYSGTFGDLHAGGDAELFGFDSFGDDFELMGSSTNSFTAVNSDAAPGTISPKDLFADSVPPSASFTNLTTPGSTFLDTPDDYQTSPLFVDQMANDKSWFSLFPEEDNKPAPVAPSMERTSSNTIIVHPGGEGNARKRSSTQASPTPFSPAPKMSDVAGVSARKRDRPLPPILVDENDTVALKRARNTAAARKSRAKKVQERDELETTIAQLQEQVRFWKQKAVDLGADSEEAP